MSEHRLQQHCVPWVQTGPATLPVGETCIREMGLSWHPFSLSSWREVADEAPASKLLKLALTLKHGECPSESPGAAPASVVKPTLQQHTEVSCSCIQGSKPL